MIVALVAGLTMLLADVGQGLYVIFLNRGRRVAAGFADGVADVFLSLSVVSAGTSVLSITTNHGAVTFHAHLTAVALTSLVALVAGSVAGATIADRLSARLTPTTERNHQPMSTSTTDELQQLADTLGVPPKISKLLMTLLGLVSTAGAGLSLTGLIAQFNSTGTTSTNVAAIAAGAFIHAAGVGAAMFHSSNIGKRYDTWRASAGGQTVVAQLPAVHNALAELIGHARTIVEAVDPKLGQKFLTLQAAVTDRLTAFEQTLAKTGATPDKLRQAVAEYFSSGPALTLLPAGTTIIPSTNVTGFASAGGTATSDQQSNGDPGTDPGSPSGAPTGPTPATPAAPAAAAPDPNMQVAQQVGVSPGT